jgi:copper transport protein
VLDAKLAALALLFALAWFNRFRLTRKVERGEHGAARTMARTILAETLMIVLVLGIVALWRFTPPPRSEAAAIAQRATASLHLHSPQAMVNLAITPARPGPVRAEISVFDASLQPIDPKEVALSLDNQAAGIERMRHVAKKGADGTWTAEFALPVPGVWKVRVEVLINDFSKATVEGDLDVTPSD